MTDLCSLCLFPFYSFPSFSTISPTQLFSETLRSIGGRTPTHVSETGTVNKRDTKVRSNWGSQSQKSRRYTVIIIVDYNPNNIPNLYNYIHFMDLTTDPVLFVIHSQTLINVGYLLIFLHLFLFLPLSVKSLCDVTQYS